MCLVQYALQLILRSGAALDRGPRHHSRAMVSRLLLTFSFSYILLRSISDLEYSLKALLEFLFYTLNVTFRLPNSLLKTRVRVKTRAPSRFAYVLMQRLFQSQHDCRIDMMFAPNFKVLMSYVDWLSECRNKSSSQRTSSAAREGG